MIGSALKDRMSHSNACPATPRSEANWSIPPVGAPTTSFSTARDRESSAPSSSPRPYASSTARTAAQTTAAEEDRPAPSGTSESIEISRPLAPGAVGSTPRSRSSQAAPRTYRAHGGVSPSSRPAGTTTGSGTCTERAVHVSAAALRTRAVQPNPMANGNVNPSL